MILGRRYESGQRSPASLKVGFRGWDAVSVTLGWLAMVVAFSAVGEALQFCCQTFN